VGNIDLAKEGLYQTEDPNEKALSEEPVDEDLDFGATPNKEDAQPVKRFESFRSTQNENDTGIVKNLWQGLADRNELAAKGFAKGLMGGSQVVGGEPDIEFIDLRQ
jgi:hypothetical protein